ncbi:hypothetical protein AGMMS49521_1310 [Campylobacterota bacterium]|nr:hypothetical protein AGMMS49521_1310 [Campylobacterota bacterium]
MYRFAPIALFIVCALMFISGVRFLASPSPLGLLLGLNDQEISPDPTATQSYIKPHQTEAETIEETTIVILGDESYKQHTTIEQQPVQPLKAMIKNDALLELLTVAGYPIANGNLQSCDNGQICAQDGTLRGVNFPELYCRAAAFSKGEQMPKAVKNRAQPFEVLQFWLSQKPIGLNALYLVSDPFILSGDLSTVNGDLKGNLTLALISDWQFPCKMDRLWHGIDLPLICSAQKNSELSCALDLRRLIESLSGVAAKATESAYRTQINTLQDDLVKRERQFRNRIRQRSNIEEIDLRELFR